ncbi:MAG: MoaD/ThiS family protein [Anaerolineales bacterium]|nr:MoaD/ThiS family protein [Anaerolineales bacterium]
MTSIRIPSPLQSYVGGNREVSVQGNSVGEVVQKLTERYPGLAIHLFTEDGSLRPYVHLYRNDTNVSDLDGMKTVIEKNDRLMIVPSIAGG